MSHRPPELRDDILGRAPGEALEDHAILVADRDAQGRGFVVVGRTPRPERVAGALGFVERGFEFCEDVVCCGTVVHGWPPTRPAVPRRVIPAEILGPNAGDFACTASVFASLPQGSGATAAAPPGRVVHRKGGTPSTVYSRAPREAPGYSALLPPPFRLDCRPERLERDAELFGDVSPPNRPPSRLPRDRALRAGEDDPVLLRWTLLCRPSMCGRPIREHTGLHRKHAPNPKPRVVVACLD